MTAYRVAYRNTKPGSNRSGRVSEGDRRLKQAADLSLQEYSKVLRIVVRAFLENHMADVALFVAFVGVWVAVFVKVLS